MSESSPAPASPKDVTCNCAFQSLRHAETCPARSLSGPAAAPTQDVIAWLIERGQREGVDPPQYWADRSGTDRTVHPKFAFRFTTRRDAEEALRAKGHDDGEGCDSCGRPVEHAWVSGAIAAPSVETAAPEKRKTPHVGDFVHRLARFPVIPGGQKAIIQSIGAYWIGPDVWSVRIAYEHNANGDESFVSANRINWWQEVELAGAVVASGETAADTDKRDAERWRKLIGIDRMMTLGSAGTPPDHMGMDFWHTHPEPSRPSTVAAFTDFVDRIPSVPTTPPSEGK